MNWQFTEAKHKLSKVISRALSEGPQRIHHNGETVIMLAEADFNLLSGNRESFIEYLLQGPGLSDLDLPRDQSPMREM